MPNVALVVLSFNCTLQGQQCTSLQTQHFGFFRNLLWSHLLDMDNLATNWHLSVVFGHIFTKAAIYEVRKKILISPLNSASTIFYNTKVVLANDRYLDYPCFQWRHWGADRPGTPYRGGGDTLTNVEKNAAEFYKGQWTIRSLGRQIVWEW